MGTGLPVEVAAVNDATAYLRCMTVHILGGRVRHDVGTPLKGTAVDRRRERVVDDEGNTMLVCDACKLLDVQDFAARVRDGLAEQRLSIGTEGGRNLLLGSLLRDESTLNTQFLQRHAKEVVCTTIYLIRGHEVVASLTDVEDGVEVGSLSAGGEHSAHATFKCRNLTCHGIVGGVLQTGVEIAFLLQVEEHGHLLRIIIFERRTLNNGQHAGVAVLGLPSCLYA